jgi:hypothetical protein
MLFAGTSSASPPPAAIPANLGARLQGLLRHEEASPGLRFDGQNRVRVRIRLNGGRGAAEVRAAVAREGAAVDALADSMTSELAAWVPIARLSAVASAAGVQAVLPLRASRSRFRGAPSLQPAALKPHAPSQASGPIGVTALAGRYTGAGVTVGVIFDSFNKCTSCSTTAADDIASGNLPGAGNPNGDTTPVVVVEESPNDFDSDGGRAMLQIIYGLAPKARLCFATVDDTQTSMAAAIASLANPAGTCKANIIVDGVAFNDEPFFSDGAIGEAVNQVTAAGVTYIASAGDDASGIYDGTFNPLFRTDLGAGAIGNLKLDQVPAALTAGGYHNFSTTGGQQIAFTLKPAIFGVPLIFQWDDPFSASKITADYNLIVFDSAGNYRSDLSGIDDNFATGEPLESVDFAGHGPYQIVISLASPATASTARHLRIVDEDSFRTVTGLPANAFFPSIRGHAGAAGAIAVSTYPFTDSTVTENYASYGPFTNVFDASGNRLPTPQTRLKPEVSGFDGLDTTFFPPGGTDPDGDGFPNLFGSAASASSVAGVAALAIQAAGGSATPAQVSAWLDASGSHAAVWATPDGFGYVNAVRATTLAAGGKLGTVATTVQLSSAQNPSAPGDAVTFSAHVAAQAASGVPSGIVTFFDGISRQKSAALDGSGNASVQFLNLDPGNSTIVAAYGGDGTTDTASVSSPLTQVVTLTTATPDAGTVTDAGTADAGTAPAQPAGKSGCSSTGSAGAMCMLAALSLLAAARARRRRAPL